MPAAALQHRAAAAERLGCRGGRAGGDPRRQQIRVLGVKPQMIDGVVQLLAAPIAASESIFVSMLAGVQLERLERLLGADKKIIRILPNTACAVGQGVVLYCANGNVTGRRSRGVLRAHGGRGHRRPHFRGVD
ncbi:MAG: pyrroline-5-carboxylate reductase family protein [Oscillospiraceae bacterium]